MSRLMSWTFQILLNQYILSSELPFKKLAHVSQVIYVHGEVVATYPIQRATVSENVVDGSLNVAVLEVMTASVVIECVLISVKRAVVKCCSVRSNAQCHGLPQYRAWWWGGCGILQANRKHLDKYIP